MINIPRTHHDVYKADMHVHWRTLMRYAAMSQAITNLGLDPALDAPGFHTQHWNGLPDFHNEYESVYARLIRNPDDMYNAALVYFEQSANENSLYSEISVTLRRNEPGKLPVEAMLEGMTHAMKTAKNYYGYEARLIANTVRNFGGEEALRVARQAVDLRDTRFPEIVGFGMSGDETCPIPLEEYLPAYEYANANDLPGTAHAGEVTKGNLKKTMRILGPYLRRFGHGITALEDEELLVNYVADTVLELCPTVYNKLGKYHNLSLVPAQDLWRAGYYIVLGTDNPGPLQTSIGNEYRIIHEICRLSLLQLSQITCTAIEHSFADKLTKEMLYTRVHEQKELLELAGSAAPQFSPHPL